ncbi:MAG: YggS family pyridoxal phosphate-dependent enzyme [Ruminococcaceae bacterium]|nr:YggS family pyridoxal phosphate-dependent enzyme [Oscillospiraceae bacterium]
MMNRFDYIRRNYTELSCELETIAARVGVCPPTLVCVTKSGSDEELVALAGCGASDIGENRTSELVRRHGLLSAAGFSPRMHQIGTLQSNKARLAAPVASLIHSVDSESLLRELSRQAVRLGKSIPVLLEINSAEEVQKGGIMPEDAERFLEKTLTYAGITPCGLMTMGPATEDKEEIRKYFRLTYRLFDDLGSRYGFGEKPILSMGMSDSYSVAIEEGSTLVRVGRRLFKKD